MIEVDCPSCGHRERREDTPPPDWACSACGAKLPPPHAQAPERSGERPSGWEDDRAENPFRPPDEVPDTKGGPSPAGRDNAAVVTVRVYGAIYAVLGTLSLVGNLAVFSLATLADRPGGPEPPPNLGGIVGALIILGLGIGLYRKSLASVVLFFVCNGLCLCCGGAGLIAVLNVPAEEGMRFPPGSVAESLGPAGLAVAGLLVWLVLYGVPLICAALNMKSFR